MIVDLVAEGKGLVGGFFTPAIGEETPSLNDFNLINPFCGVPSLSCSSVEIALSKDEVEEE